MTAPDTLYNQSLNYLHGKNVPENLERAFVLCSEAAASNHNDAVLAMGWHYLNGVGVERNLPLALSWYRKSARQGEPRAMFSLGQMAYYSRDYAEAGVWLDRALRKGHARSGCWLAKVTWRLAQTKQDRAWAVKLLQEAAAKNVQEAKVLVRRYEKCRRAAS
jgi:TPR repeat protein